ncbi:MAG TPA: tRNA pseudouridine(38-40) synthase TruA [Burkholderiales bacterium]|jgi:tRNA pseudouridine38-40 synthase|nr:tRNA pseudouridine(38-40) synthase TruA [Burkholderiales bacterium]
MMRVALGIEYNGSAFCGWQTQPSRCAVQDALELALAKIAGEKIATICAGRTDAGVHALDQVVHFDTGAERPPSAWVRGTSALLPQGAAVIWAQPAAAEFHARYSAYERCYRYVLLNHPVRPAINQGRVGWVHLPLDIESMRAAARHLIGEHDFSAFRSAECQAKSPVRDLKHLDIRGSGDYIVFELVANSFLHHMVRNIVGSLVYVGKGRHDPAWLASVLASRDRKLAAPTLEAAGLYLARVGYDAKWGLVQAVRRAWFDEH